jgi:CDGSH-type Zn-finger protein
VTAYPDGPLVVRGEFTVTDADGAHVPTGRIAALCRCGRSAVKPLCDGSHNNAAASAPRSAGRGERDGG